MQTVPLTTSPQTKVWRILSLLDWSTHHLLDKGFDEARLNVELMLAHVLGLSRLELYTKFDRPLDAGELAEFKRLFQRRLTHEPLQYILGEAEFMGFLLYVSPDVLIPRPETEQLVEKTLEAIRSSGKDRVHILDIGTGSGNIPIALVKFAGQATVTSIDVSKEALHMAERNVARNHAERITLKEADVFEDFLPAEQFDIMVSNPPYISKNEFMSLQPEVRDFEPQIATTDGGDGFRFIRRISEVASKRLGTGGWLLVEIAYNQEREARSIAKGAGLEDVAVFKDYSGNSRILSARRSR